jgi:hypothetical protein
MCTKAHVYTCAVCVRVCVIVCAYVHVCIHVRAAEMAGDEAVLP